MGLGATCSSSRHSYESCVECSCRELHCTVRWSFVVGGYSSSTSGAVLVFTYPSQ